MSITIMARLFKARLGTANRKILAIRLADFADDEGRGIWPTVGRLSAETELSERTVQRILKEFVDEGLLVEVSRANGRPGQATRYDFDLSVLGRIIDGMQENDPIDDGCQAGTGVTVSPVRVTNERETGDNGDIDGCHRDTRTIIEPLDHPSRKQDAREQGRENDPDASPKSALAELTTVLDVETARAVMEHRRTIRRPLTPHAARLLARKFAQMPDPRHAADVMIGNGWQGFDPSWVKDRPSSRASPSAPQRPETAHQKLKSAIRSAREIEHDLGSRRGNQPVDGRLRLGGLDGERGADGFDD
ncbi:hypothetical protein BJF92_11235 [Rhizobium rhizosphaerae]|uniref:Helix-turn-helix domain-containing protein n=1 Tax=Xaviernesmea rhizosphaerae TaxID=1672749 RepID=A0A1Q9AMP0_9HYPH|nr:helix-turn-helix domain-containing protein [Xaviernesmea rhizosphaerae]OLP56654.1 hypothetical protein BJF92_11235 [Xaviernesmea rhizosphaerae]